MSWVKSMHQGIHCCRASNIWLNSETGILTTNTGGAKWCRAALSVRTSSLSWQHRGSEPQEKAGMCWRLLTANDCLAPVYSRLLACLLTYQGHLLSAALKGRQTASAECPGGLPGGRAATLSEAGKAALISMPPVHALQDSLACVMRATVVAMSVCCPSSACMPQAQGYIARPKPFHSAGTKGSLGITMPH